MTVLFYAALQLVDAHAVQNEHVLSAEHQARRLYVQNRLTSIHPHYRRLEGVSRYARYQMQAPTADELQGFHDREFQHIAAQLRNRGIGL